jgi:hypothetical protein
MKKVIRNYAGAIASTLFMFFNASTYGSTKEPFFIFGTIIGLLTAIVFWNLIDKD